VTDDAEVLEAIRFSTQLKERFQIRHRIGILNASSDLTFASGWCTEQDYTHPQRQSTETLEGFSTAP
jgi:hypothetical protein